MNKLMKVNHRYDYGATLSHICVFKFAENQYRIKPPNFFIATLVQIIMKMPRIGLDAIARSINYFGASEVHYYFAPDCIVE